MSRRQVLILCNCSSTGIPRALSLVSDCDDVAAVLRRNDSCLAFKTKRLLRGVGTSIDMNSNNQRKIRAQSTCWSRFRLTDSLLFCVHDDPKYAYHRQQQQPHKNPNSGSIAQKQWENPVQKRERSRTERRKSSKSDSQTLANDALHAPHLPRTSTVYTREIVYRNKRRVQKRRRRGTSRRNSVLDETARPTTCVRERAMMLVCKQKAE